jgi:hypothetical protein
MEVFESLEQLISSPDHRDSTFRAPNRAGAKAILKELVYSITSTFHIVNNVGQKTT